MSKLIDSHLIGQSIKCLRLKNHLTQGDLADHIGYSVRNLRRIETDGTSNIDVVNTFADYFNVSALDILNGCFFVIRLLNPYILDSKSISLSSYSSSMNSSSLKRLISSSV